MLVSLGLRELSVILSSPSHGEGKQSQLFFIALARAKKSRHSLVRIDRTEKSVQCHLVIALNGFQFSCVGLNFAIAEPYKWVEKLAQKYSQKPLKRRRCFFPFFDQSEAKQIMTQRAHASARFPLCGLGCMFYSSSFDWLIAFRLMLVSELLRASICNVRLNCRNTRRKNGKVSILLRLGQHLRCGSSPERMFALAFPS